MDFDGKYILKASRIAVWDALNDTKCLQAAIPGCNRIEWTSEQTLEASVSVNLGVMKPNFVGDLVLTDVRPAQTYTLSGQGRGGLLGLAHGQAKISLEDHAEGTLLILAATGGASGQLMRLGKTIIGSSAQKVIDRFFEHFADAMGAEIESLAP